MADQRDHRPGSVADAILADVSTEATALEAALRETLRRRYRGVYACVQELSDRAVRARRLVENLDRGCGPIVPAGAVGEGHLTLLQFFLNHRRYLRSEDPIRVGKSPAELLTGEPHAHWLEHLGTARSPRTEATARQPEDSPKPAPAREHSECRSRPNCYRKRAFSTVPGIIEGVTRKSNACKAVTRDGFAPAPPFFPVVSAIVTRAGAVSLPFGASEWEEAEPGRTSCNGNDMDFRMADLMKTNSSEAHDESVIRRSEF